MSNSTDNRTKTVMKFMKSKLILLSGSILVASAVTSTMIYRQWFAAPDFMQQAFAALKRGDREAAISALRSQIQENPEFTAARLKLATLLQDANPEEAIQCLQQIPSSDLERENAVQKIAVLSILHHRTLDAEQALLELAAKKPDSLGPQLSLAELYFQNQKPQAALPYAEQAARIAPARAQTFLLLSEIHDEMQHPEKMIEPLQEAIRLEPDSYEAHQNLAYAFHKTGDSTGAEQQARWCLNVNSRDVAALRILASVARDNGQFEDAEKHLTAALQVEPRNLDCRILEADLLLYQRKPEVAYERLQELYDAQQDTVRYLGALARAAASAGKREESRKLHQKMAGLLQQPATGESGSVP